MSKEIWRPGNMLYPLPSVLVTVADDEGNDNVLTVAWTGTVCSDPAMVYVSVRPSRYSHHMIKETGEFVINLTTEELAYATDYCGVKSGKDEDKFKNALAIGSPVTIPNFFAEMDFAKTIPCRFSLSPPMMAGIFRMSIFFSSFAASLSNFTAVQLK